jgi:CheR methyltransferase, SAM binding domain
MKSNAFTYSRPTSISFTGKGLLGYAFGPLNQSDIDVYYIEVEKGHDTFMISSKITRTYYVLAGMGYFTIDSQRFDVGPGVLVEVPPRVEYCYSGKMTLIAFARPRLFSGNDTHTKWNPDVVGDATCVIDRGTWATRLVGSKIFGKSPLNAFLRLNRRLWSRLPSSIAALYPIHFYGGFLQRLVRIQSVRSQSFTTSFLRNRPELELIRRLLDQKTQGSILRVAVLGCSTGAEAYSVAWRIRSARPDLKLVLHAVDISRQAVEIAKSGAYSLRVPQLTASNVAEHLTAAEMEEMFHKSGDVVTVKPWIRERIDWRVADVGDPKILEDLGSHDLVMANNFLCDMDASEAERCLRNIVRLVSPYGYLFVSGVDLEIRTRVACDLGWRPLQELLEEIHDGDPWLRQPWPLEYRGLEPLNQRRRDWRIRYAAAFQVVPGASSLSAGHENELSADVQPQTV